MKVRAHTNGSDFFSKGNEHADKLAKNACTINSIVSAKRKAGTDVSQLEQKVLKN